MNSFDLGGQLLRVGKAVTPPDGQLVVPAPPVLVLNSTVTGATAAATTNTTTATTTTTTTTSSTATLTPTSAISTISMNQEVDQKLSTVSF